MHFGECIRGDKNGRRGRLGGYAAFEGGGIKIVAELHASQIEANFKSCDQELHPFASTGLARPLILRVPKNGLIALNVPLDQLRLGALSTRTTHPFYIARWNELVGILANADLEKEVEHSVRIAKIVTSHHTGRYPELFPLKEVPWYAPGDEEVPKWQVRIS